MSTSPGALQGWRFPGIGEFQCYDRRARASLAYAAATVGRPEWGYAGPHDAGSYRSVPEVITATHMLPKTLDPSPKVPEVVTATHVLL